MRLPSLLLVKVHPILRSIPSTSSFSTQPQHHYDVIVVGGGAVGLAMANLLQVSCPRYSCTVLDAGSSNSQRFTTGTGSATTTACTAAAPNDSSSQSIIPHPRSYALSPKSLHLMGSNVTSKLQGSLGEYHSMQIWEADSPAMLVFSNHDLDPKLTKSNDHDDNQPLRLGACVEDAALVSALQASLSSDCIRANTSLTNISFPSNRRIEITTTAPTAPADKDSKVSHTNTYTTDLLIAADGAQSPVRNMLGIGWKGLDYGRTAVSFTVELEAQSSNERAYQRFLPHGPIALLPTFSKQHAVVVWSTTPEHANKLKSMDSVALTHILNETLQQGPQRLRPLLEREGKTDPLSAVLYGLERVLDTVHYGMGMRHWSDDAVTFQSPPMIASVPDQSPRFTFPLSCKMASNYIHHNRKIALIGDAAHTVHPMAGQGLNIGLEDVAALSHVIQKAHDCGMEAGQFLQDYQYNRQWKVPTKVGGIHFLHSLFGMQSELMMHGKSIGMSAVNQFSPLRRQLAKIATGMD